MGDRRTRALYDERAAVWMARRDPTRRSKEAESFGASLEDAAICADLGCGPGWHLDSLGRAGAVVGLERSRSMLALAAQRRPFVLGDLRRLPFRRHALDAAWASNSYVHLARAELPMALWDLHRCVRPGGKVALSLFGGEIEGNLVGGGDGDRHGDDIVDDGEVGRFFSSWRVDHLRDVLVGAGFGDITIEVEAWPPGFDAISVRATRLNTLADTVAPGMRVLVVGLNPSPYAADVGVGFARSGNRFWPAARAAELVDRDRDPLAALTRGVGMTDLVKRATARADELSRDEYAVGASRVERLARWLEPGVICFAGLAGYRSAINRKASAGVQAETFGGRPVYVMPNPSGLNAGSTLETLAAHLRHAAALASQESGAGEL